MKIRNELVLIGAAGVVAYFLYHRFGTLLPTAEQVKEAFNPGSDKNLAYQGANAVTQAVTGDPNTSFGSWLYDIANPNDPANHATDPSMPNPNLPNVFTQRRYPSPAVMQDQF